LRAFQNYLNFRFNKPEKERLIGTRQQRKHCLRAQDFHSKLFFSREDGYCSFEEEGRGLEICMRKCLRNEESAMICISEAMLRVKKILQMKSCLL
jgi:hypothetical protein